MRYDSLPRAFYKIFLKGIEKKGIYREKENVVSAKFKTFFSLGTYKKYISQKKGIKYLWLVCSNYHNMYIYIGYT